MRRLEACAKAALKMKNRAPDELVPRSFVPRLMALWWQIRGKSSSSCGLSFNAPRIVQWRRPTRQDLAPPMTVAA
jgi:hypothetical protein